MRHCLLTCALIALLAAPAPAREDAPPAPLIPIVNAACQPPAGMSIRTLAIRDIVNAKTRAHGALSDWLETSLVAAITRCKPAFSVLNNGTASDLPSGLDAVLSGVYQRDPATRQLNLNLLVQDARTKALLFKIPECSLNEAILPAQALEAENFGRLVLDLDVADALVLVDGAPMGSGSLAIPMAAGGHLVTVAAEGYDVYEAPVNIETETPTLLHVRMHRQVARAKVETLPNGALVTVDGKSAGSTPLTLDALAPGAHRLGFQRQGYQPLESTIEWEGKRPQLYRFELKLLPGNLLVNADVPGAVVSLDQRLFGRAPLLISDLAAGQHVLSVSAPGYASFEQSIVVSSGKTATCRARLSPEVMREEGESVAIALVAKTGIPEETRLVAELGALLSLQGIPIVEPSALNRSLDRVMPDGFKESPALVRTLTHQIKAKRLVAIQWTEFSPYARLGGFFPLRPVLKVSLASFRGNGNPEGEPREIEVSLGEPWSLMAEGPGLEELSTAMASKLASILGAKSAVPDPSPALLNETSMLIALARIQAGFGYERRVLPFMSLGAAYQYQNAFGSDRMSGTTLRSTSAGPDLVYGLAQSHLARFDALLRLDGQAPLKHPYFDGPRLSPYLGLGYRLDLARYEVYGIGHKESEGGFLQLQNRAVVLLGSSLNLYGTSFRAEAEIPVAYQRGDAANPRFTLGCGWLY